MIFIRRKETDPYFNLAAEEYILKNIEDDVFMLWQNSPSVVVGKHQNALAEINLAYLTKKGIPVIRRISGGGTVFHDKGNLNYTVITSEKNRERLIDFKKFSQPIIEFLKTLNIVANFEGKNNLVVENKKISGNAAHVFKNRVMHHGTLLVDSNLDILEKAIKPSNLIFEDRAVQSVRAKVGNLNEFINPKLDVSAFIDLLSNFLLEFHAVPEIKSLTEFQKNKITLLAEEKYNSWDWNFGYSPMFTLKNELDNMQAAIQVKNGLIQNLELKGDMNNPKSLVSILSGHPYQPDLIKATLTEMVNEKKQLAQLMQLLGFF